MQLDTIRNALAERPTRPHVLTLAGGETVEVPHPDFALFPGPQTGLDFFIVVRSGGGFRVVSVDAVSSIDVPAARA